MTGFKKKFFDSIIMEADIPAAALAAEAEAEETSPEDAFDKSLDHGTPTDTFNDVPDNPEISFKKEQTAQSVGTLQNWISEVEGFISFLNGLDEGSMNYQLNKADCDSIMSDVRRSETKKISRLAQDLSSLGEALKQYLLSAERTSAESV
jgi:hypothetical protein